MVARMTSWLYRPGLLRTVLSQVRLAIRLVREPGITTLLTKALPLLAALYLFSPADLVTDVIPLLGQIDDVGVMLISLEVFLRLPGGGCGIPSRGDRPGRRYGPMSPADHFVDAEWRRGEHGPLSLPPQHDERAGERDQRERHEAGRFERDRRADRRGRSSRSA